MLLFLTPYLLFAYAFMALFTYSSGSSEERSSADREDSSTSEDRQPNKRAKVSLPSEAAPTNGIPSWAQKKLRQLSQEQEWEAPELHPGKDPETLPHRRVAHQGRVRAFPHVEGVYPVVVAIPVTLSEEQQQQVANLISSLQKVLPGLHPISPFVSPPPPSSSQPEQQQEASAAETGHTSTSTHPTSPRSNGGPAHSHSSAHSHGGGHPHRPGTVAGAPGHGPPASRSEAEESLHISLSRTLPVRFAAVETLVMTLKEELQGLTRCEIGLEGLECLVNDDRTRTFLVVPVTSGVRQVVSAIHHVDRAFKLHDLAPFHEDPRPHLSIAWLLGDFKEELEEAVRLTTQEVPQQPPLAVQPSAGSTAGEVPNGAAAADPKALAGASTSAQGQQHQEEATRRQWQAAGNGQGAGLQQQDQNPAASGAQSEAAAGGEGQVSEDGLQDLVLQPPSLLLPLSRVICRVGVRDHVVWQAE